MVLVVSVLLAGVFYMADHYSHIIGNFYFLCAVLIVGYAIYSGVSRAIAAKGHKTDDN